MEEVEKAEDYYMEQKVILVNLPPSTNYNYRSAGSIYPATGILVIGPF